MKNYNDSKPINIGFGEDYTIKELVAMVAEITGYTGEIIWDTSKPDGTPKRLLDSSRIFNMGWKPKIPLKEGLTKTIEWYELH